MPVYRFVGRFAASLHLEVALDTFGQRVELSAKAAEALQRDGCALLTEAEFQSFGFSPEELKTCRDGPWKLSPDFERCRREAQILSTRKREFLAERSL